MKPNRRVVDLPWEGEATVKEARKAMTEGSEVEIALPVNMHYVLSRHLHPQAAPGEPNAVDQTGGAEIIARMATLQGLESMHPLERAVQRSHYRVRLVSPSPLLMLSPPAR